jgi:predicted enzyme related to lactoylglutathione lyase
MKDNIVGWFEIPVTDMDRAIAFYETVFDLRLQRRDLGVLQMALFPAVEGRGAAGSLVRHPDFYHPHREQGVLVYLNAPSGDLARELGRVAAAGGEVLQEKKQIAPGAGYMALFVDTEGNRLAMHSRH